MLPRQFTDPLGSRLPALDRSILKLRGTQMLLVLFYAEELKRDILSLIRTTDRMTIRLKGDKAPPDRVPGNTNNAKDVEKALKALVADGAISIEQKKEIVKLIEYRNIIGHQMYNLLVDVSNERITLEILTFPPDRVPKYQYGAVERLGYFRELLDGLYGTHHYASELRMNRLIFKAAENTFLDEIRRLKRKCLNSIKCGKRKSCA